MKKLVILSLCLVLIGSMNALVYDGAEDEDVMSIQADILETTVGINVPSNAEFGEVTKGYVSERQDIDIENTGTTDINVIPVLNGNYSGEYFNYIFFQETLSSELQAIGSFELEIEKPNSIGGTRTEDIYMYLDLTEFEEDIPNDVIGHNANITFWAIPA